MEAIGGGCSDGFEIGCDDGRRVRVAFALDCCDREAMGHVATTGGVTGEMIRDLMLESVERRFGPAGKPPETIEWLSDNGSRYTAADTRSFAKALNLKPITTPSESPQSNGMAEAFVRTIKRRLRALRQPIRRQNRHRSAARMARRLQRRSSAPRTRISFPKTVHRPKQGHAPVRSLGGYNRTR